MSVRELLGASSSLDEKLDVESVFSTYLYTGNGATQAINNGIDLAGKGGLVWIKSRTQEAGHILTDTLRGPTKYILSSGTDSEYTNAASLTQFNSNGFNLGSMGGVNTSGANHVSWTFRKAPKFFDVQTKVHTTGTPSTIDLSTLGVVGMVTVKATNTTSNWFAWHKDLAAGNNLKLNLIDAQSTTNAYLSVSGTTLTISGSAPSRTYVIYAWAHDSSADGMIQCGSFTTDASGNATVELGWEPQYLLTKCSSGTGNWGISDNMRGMAADKQTSSVVANSSAAESLGTFIGITPTGFSPIPLAANATYIYLAIRRPMKVPTSGTEVYNAIVRTGTGAVATVNGAGFAPDLAIIDAKDRTDFYIGFYDRLRGKGATLYSPLTDTEINNTNALGGFDVSDGYSTSIGGAVNMSGVLYINHFFKRAKGFFDNFCWTGTGVNRTIAHNLGVAPELLILKSRSDNGDWQVWFSGLASNEKLVLNSTAAKVTDATLLNSTLPTSTLISLGTQEAVNTSSATYVGYAFSSLAGVSKVGSYTGNGTSQTIPCGFSTGARFILIKRTDSTGDWYIWDTVRGIVAANDPHLSLNTTAAEVTTDDSIDPASSGFIVNQVAATNINVNGGSYIFLAIA